MAVTQNLYTGDGSTRDYAFAFQYLDPSHVKVTINGNPTTAFTFFTSSVLRFTTAPSFGVSVRIYRETPSESLLADYTAGTAIRESDLEASLKQILYVAQETQTFAESQSTAGLQAQIQTANNNANAAVTAANNAVNTATSANNTANSISTSLTQFTQAGTGAVTRTLQSKLRDTVSVKDFGAVGDGVADDASAIRAAVNAVFPRGTIIFPEGTYYINSNVTVGGAGTLALIELRGEGGTGGAVELRAGPGISNGSMITFADSNCDVRSLFFNTGAASNATAIEFLGDNNNGKEAVEGCTFTGWNKAMSFRTDSYTVSRCYAIACTNFIVGENWAMNGTIRDNYVLGGRRSVWLRKDYTAASPQQAEGVSILNNCFLNTLDNALPIDIQSGLEILIEGNIIDQTGQFGVGINLQPVQSGDAISYTKIQNNWICSGNGTTGACIIGDSALAGTDVSRVWVTNNTLLTALSTLTGNKPAVYLNLVNTYWLMNNSVFTGSTVPLFLLNSCFNGLQFGNHSRLTADTTVTRNTLNNGLDFTNQYSLSVNGTVVETVSPQGLKTFKSAAGNTVSQLTYNGIPEGNVAANPGSSCFRTDSGQFYFKEGTGTGTTGWQQMISKAGLSAGLDISSLYSLSVGGNLVETVSTQGLKTFKSAAGGTISFFTYNGIPEGNVAANPGSICLRTDSGGLYIKQGTGTGTTGWVLK